MEDPIIVTLCVPEFDASTAAPQPVGASDLFERLDAASFGAENAFVAAPEPAPVAAPAQPACARQRVLMPEFQTKRDRGEWPSTTSVHCHWCCHRFDGAPVGLPVRRDADGSYHVRGCFCGFACAAAFNASLRVSNDECMTQYALLNGMAREISGGHVTTPVQPAPDRYTLAIFGGPYGIDEFRAKSERVSIVMPAPMRAIAFQAEEVCATEVRSEYRFVPLDGERVSKIAEKQKLKRSKPTVASHTNTIDNSLMRIRLGAR